MELKNSKTFVNLARAYAGECQARVRYEFIEYGARINGYKNIADIIDEIVYQEFNHARMFYTFIQRAETSEIPNINIEAGYPFKEKWNMTENLKIASEDEQGDADAYLKFAETAREEGFEDIATLFEDVAKVEKYHKQVFLELYDQMKNDTLYKKDKPVIWVCADCGYMAESETAWDECPLCLAKQGSIKLILEAFEINKKYCK